MEILALSEKKGMERVYIGRWLPEKRLSNHILKIIWDCPGGAVVKNPPANAEDTGSSPGPGRSHMPRSN